jgi:hypothetical protein
MLGAQASRLRSQRAKHLKEQDLPLSPQPQLNSARPVVHIAEAKAPRRARRRRCPRARRRHCRRDRGPPERRDDLLLERRGRTATPVRLRCRRARTRPRRPGSPELAPQRRDHLRHRPPRRRRRAPRAPACRCSAGRSEPQENLMPVPLRNATADGSGPVSHWPGGAGTRCRGRPIRQL